eukprot:351963-Chlamydomonas_euryale.AAC.11
MAVCACAFAPTDRGRGACNHELNPLSYATPDPQPGRPSAARATARLGRGCRSGGRCDACAAVAPGAACKTRSWGLSAA